MRGQPTQHVSEVDEGIDVDEATALDERVENRGPAVAFEAADEDPVLPTMLS
jgi:hypothetical protein